jgi:hypothetical protein
VVVEELLHLLAGGLEGEVPAAVARPDELVADLGVGERGGEEGGVGFGWLPVDEQGLDVAGLQGAEAGERVPGLADAVGSGGRRVGGQYGGVAVLDLDLEGDDVSGRVDGLREPPGAGGPRVRRSRNPNGSLTG